MFAIPWFVSFCFAPSPHASTCRPPPHKRKISPPCTNKPKKETPKPSTNSQSLLHGNRRSKRLKAGAGVVAEVRQPGPFWRGVRFGDPLQKRRAKGSEAGTGMVNEIRRARQLRSGV